jgi:ketosteroid isomerase-like protein
MSQDNLGAARGLYDAFNRGDTIAFEKACAPAFIWNEAESSLYSAGNPYRNFREVAEHVFQPTMRDFDDFRCDLEKLFDAGGTIVTTGRYRGKNKTTGKPLSAQFCHVLHFDGDGRLDGVQEFTDTLQEALVSGRTQVTEELRIPQPAM